MLIIDVGVIDTGTDGQALLVQLFAVLAEQLVVQLRVLRDKVRSISISTLYRVRMYSFSMIVLLSGRGYTMCLCKRRVIRHGKVKSIDYYADYYCTSRAHTDLFTYNDK